MFSYAPILYTGLWRYIIFLKSITWSLAIHYFVEKYYMKAIFVILFYKTRGNRELHAKKSHLFAHFIPYKLLTSLEPQGIIPVIFMLRTLFWHAKFIKEFKLYMTKISSVPYFPHMWWPGRVQCGPTGEWLTFFRVEKIVYIIYVLMKFYFFIYDFLDFSKKMKTNICNTSENKSEPYFDISLAIILPKDHNIDVSESYMMYVKLEIGIHYTSFLNTGLIFNHLKESQ